MFNSKLRVFVLASAVLGLAVLASSVAQAATFVVINNDGAGEGFNDPTPASPVGGNTGTTVGAQRLIAFQYAANIWGGLLSSNVQIRVGAQFNPLTCTATSAVLGQAGPNSYFHDFSGAPVGSTWYPVALANALHGSDLDPGVDDIGATFSSTIGTPGCLTSSGWYYGLDGNPPSNRIDFVSVLVHELGHGLGFLTIVNLTSGAKASGLNDTYMRFLEDHGKTPSDYPSMSNAQRLAASIDTGNLHWVGPHVEAASGVLSAGKVGNHVRMYAPNPQEPGSSVSHWDTALTPNQIMEPSYTGALHSPSLELPLFEDIGWTLITTTPPPPPPPPPTGNIVVNDFGGDGRSDILWHNGNGTAAIWFMDGATPYKQSAIGTVDTAWQIAGTSSLVQSTGDFDGDGNADMLWRNSDGSVGIWLMNGTSPKAQVGIGVVDTAWQIAGLGDFDGDGKCRHPLAQERRHRGVVADERNDAHDPGRLRRDRHRLADRRHRRLRRRRQGRHPVAQERRHRGDVADERHHHEGPGRYRLRRYRLADRRRRRLRRRQQGRYSLASRNGSLAIWEMNGITPKVQVSLGSVDTSWQVVSTGDYDGDGKGDILWRNTDGSGAIWQMNGTSPKSQVSIGTVDTTWTIVE